MLEQLDRAVRLAGTRIVDSVGNFLPGMLVFLALLAGSLVVALILRYTVRKALNGMGFDRRSELFGMSLADWTAARSTSALVASVVYWTILVLGVLLALTALDAALPTRFAVAVLQYVPHVVAAVAILFVGAVVARFLARAILIEAVNMGVQYARALSMGIKWLVLIVAAAMALDHIGIGRTVLLLAFGILFGGVVLAIALAVGLGARDVVARAIQRRLREPSGDDKLHHV